MSPPGAVAAAFATATDAAAATAAVATTAATVVSRDEALPTETAAAATAAAGQPAGCSRSLAGVVVCELHVPPRRRMRQPVVLHNVRFTKTGRALTRAASLCAASDA